MERETNLELARRSYAYFSETQDVLWDNIHPDFVLDMSTFTGWPEQKTYRGVDGLKAFLADWLGAWDDYSFEVEELREAGDQVVAIVRQSGRAKSTGVEVDMHLSHVLSFRDGLNSGNQMYATAEEGLRAVGLEP